MTCKSIITTFHSFLNARISPKENSGASGGFLPKPLLLRLRHPNSKKMSRVFCQILSPKNSFGKTESAFRPATLPEYLEGRTPKEKHPFLFQKKFHPRQIRNARSVFSFGVAEALRGGGGAIHSWSKKVRANARITPPNETSSELRKRSDFAEAKIALSIFSKLFPPTAEAVNSQSSPQ